MKLLFLLLDLSSELSDVDWLVVGIHVLWVAIIVFAVYALIRGAVVLCKKLGKAIRRKQKRDEIALIEALGDAFLYNRTSGEIFGRPKEAIGFVVEVLEKVSDAGFIPLRPLLVNFRRGVISAHVNCEAEYDGSIIAILSDGKVEVDSSMLLVVECDYVSTISPAVGYKVIVRFVAEGDYKVKAVAEKK